MIDRLWRLAYRLGFRAARLWWRLRRPDHGTALVAVWLGGRVLAVRQSYRANPSWPGGGIRRGEQPREAARRELREELGLQVAPDDLVLAREMVVDWDFRRDRVRVFELRLRAEPVLRTHDREVVAARFVEPRALLAKEGLPPFIRARLDEEPRAAGARPARPDATAAASPRATPTSDEPAHLMGVRVRGVPRRKATPSDGPGLGGRPAAGRRPAGWRWLVAEGAAVSASVAARATAPR